MPGKFYQTLSTDTLKDSTLMNGVLYFNSDTGTYVYPLDNTGAFVLPPDITTDSSTFFFIPDSTQLTADARDTFTLFYQRKLKFISVACGFQTEFELSKVMYSGHVIDSIFIPKPEVNSDANQQHLSIILKTP
jgi:hypothetical protein